MTSREKRNQRIDALNARFARKYQSAKLAGRPFFIMDNGHVFAPDSIPDFDCLVLEHADSLEDASKNLLEDGDCFPMDMTEDAMYEAMIAEIES